jgi:hypothetical protein
VSQLVWLIVNGRPEPQFWPSDVPDNGKPMAGMLGRIADRHDLDSSQEKMTLSELVALFPAPVVTDN